MWKGFEAYSLACTVKTLFPESRLKVWGNDNDLLSISMAPNLVFSTSDLPEDFNSFCVQGKNGYQFNDVIKTAVLFEYHDVLNQNPFPNVDVIFARDLISFLKPEEQAKLFQEFKNKLVPGGLLILGQNETILDNAGWNLIESGSLVAFKKEND